MVHIHKVSNEFYTFKPLKIELQHISKRFDEQVILHDINQVFEYASISAILGANGAGKSTLLQIIAGQMSPSKGKVLYQHNAVNIEADKLYTHLSYCAPYLELIEEMTLLEFLAYHFSFKKALIPIEDMMKYIGLEAAKNKMIEKFSSGMKQRVKLAQAIFSDTSLLILDEPCSNLDVKGISLFEQMIHEFKRDRTIIIASNDPQEYACCEQFIQLDNLNHHKPSHVER